MICRYLRDLYRTFVRLSATETSCGLHPCGFRFSSHFPLGKHITKSTILLDRRYFIFLGIPLLFYGLAAIALIKHTEIVTMSDGQKIPIYFLYPEDKGSPH